MDIVKHLKKEAILWKNGLALVQARRSAWDNFEKRVVSQFSSLITEAKTQKLYENLYISTSSEKVGQKSTHKFVSLYWGQHPTGNYEFQGERKGRMVMERGCALHLSQLHTGEVIATFYPFHSALSKPPKQYYVYKLYSSPETVREKDIQWLTRILFSLARSSSFARMLTPFDFCILIILKFRFVFRNTWHKDWTNALMPVIGKALDAKIDEIAKGES